MPQFTYITIDATGNVYAGAGWHGLPANYSDIWKWNGTAWATMNTGLPTVPVSPSPEVTSMVIDASGNLFAGTAKILLNGGGQGFGVYKWNGSSWNSFGTGLSNLNVASLDINSAGELFAETFNSVFHISATAGGAWTNSTTGLPSTATTVRSITFMQGSVICPSRQGHYTDLFIFQIITAHHRHKAMPLQIPQQQLMQ